MNESFTDSFQDDRPLGKTIDTKCKGGIERKGIDREKAIAIDNNALRFKPLIQPGWGRQGIAYGEYQRQNGLAVAVLILNGHNTSQAETIEWLYKRISRWLKGSETESVMQRIVAWLGSKQKQETVKRLLGWLRIASEVTKFFPLPPIDDNLAVGWFADAVPNNPTQTGNGFVVRATGAENGELLASVGTKLLPIFRGLQNVPVYYVVILREQGAAYYAASLPQVYGLSAYPQLRPVAIDGVNSEATVYAGVHQSVLGQIGFRAETRVSGVKVETIAELETWYGTAHAADSLIGQSNLTNTAAEVGGSWSVLSGGFERTEKGLVARENNSLAILDPQANSGLLHLEIFTGDAPADLGIIWRFRDRDNYWCCRLNQEQLCLQLIEAGQTKEIYISTEDYLVPNSVTYWQILDDGQEFRIYLNGKLVGDRPNGIAAQGVSLDKQLAEATGIGVTIFKASNLYLRHFEAHPRTVTIPNLDLGSPWWREGSDLVIQDDFNFWQGDLTGKTTSLGNKVWSKTLGQGAFKMQSGITKIEASVEHPLPGRTAYTVAWDHSSFADMSVTIFPPGKERGQGEKGRGGLIFWQDKDNYIIINTWLDDFYEGESISCFFRIDGFEEIYDAVWSNIGKAIAFGQPYTLRVVFDGNNYTVRVNQQTVLYRALTDVYPWANALSINRLGIVANWEWGNDTGSGFSNFMVMKE
ncbi:MAG TPA: hypothetical protein V6C71_11520 [Coleofasciculaceae cyanobacterium]|jgi:hypothetical protein